MKRTKNIQPLVVKRPWGTFIQFVSNTSSTVKIITVKPNESLSLQYHASREEFWHVISGKGRVVVGNRRYSAAPGKEFTVASKVAHRIQAGSVPLVILEIARGVFKESDIVRIEDNYGRVTKK